MEALQLFGAIMLAIISYSAIVLLAQFTIYSDWCETLFMVGGCEAIAIALLLMKMCNNN